MTGWYVLLRWGFAPDPKVYRFTESIHLVFGRAMIRNRKSTAQRRYPHAFAGPALESVLTVALSSVTALYGYHGEKLISTLFRSFLTANYDRK